MRTLTGRLISGQAEFDDFDFRTGAVPARLVRSRSWRRRLFVTRERVMQGTWQKLDLDGYTKVTLDLLY